MQDRVVLAQRNCVIFRWSTHTKKRWREYKNLQHNARTPYVSNNFLNDRGNTSLCDHPEPPSAASLGKATPSTWIVSWASWMSTSALGKAYPSQSPLPVSSRTTRNRCPDE